MVEKDKDDTFKLSPKDTADRPSLHGSANLRPRIPDEDYYTRGRFEVIPTTALKDDYASKSKTEAAGSTASTEAGKKPKRHRYNGYETEAESSASTSAKGSSTADNYRQLYLDQKNDDDMKYHNQLGEKKLGEITQKQKQEEARKQDEALQQRTQANDIQQKITYWQNQTGQGQFDDYRIATELDDLRRQLGFIPQNLWQ